MPHVLAAWTLRCFIVYKPLQHCDRVCCVRFLVALFFRPMLWYDLPMDLGLTSVFSVSHIEHLYHSKHSQRISRCGFGKKVRTLIREKHIGKLFAIQGGWESEDYSEFLNLTFCDVHYNKSKNTLNFSFAEIPRETRQGRDTMGSKTISILAPSAKRTPTTQATDGSNTLTPRSGRLLSSSCSHGSLVRPTPNESIT